MEEVSIIVRQLTIGWMSVPVDVLTMLTVVLSIPAVLINLHSRNLIGIVASGIAFAAMVSATTTEQPSLAWIALALLWLNSAVSIQQRRTACIRSMIDSHLSISSRQLTTFLEQIDRRSQLLDAQFNARGPIDATRTPQTALGKPHEERKFPEKAEQA